MSDNVPVRWTTTYPNLVATGETVVVAAHYYDLAVAEIAALKDKLERRVDHMDSAEGYIASLEHRATNAEMENSALLTENAQLKHDNEALNKSFLEALQGAKPIIEERDQLKHDKELLVRTYNQLFEAAAQMQDELASLQSFKASVIETVAEEPEPYPAFGYDTFGLEMEHRADHYLRMATHLAALTVELRERLEQYEAAIQLVSESGCLAEARQYALELMRPTDKQEKV